MNRRHPAVAVAAVIAVLLVGCSSSPAPPKPAATSSPSAAASAAASPSTQPPATQPAQPSGTQVITYNPWASAGKLASGITAASTVSGYCFAPSGTTNAPGAFRCAAGNIIYDPCITDGSNPTPGQECAYPTTGNPDSVVVLRLTSPPSPQTPPTSTPATAPYFPWLLVLANGQRCGPVTGTGGPAIDGKPQDDNCNGGGALYGNPDESSATWTVSYVPAGAGASAMTQVDVTTAYE